MFGFCCSSLAISSGITLSWEKKKLKTEIVVVLLNILKNKTWGAAVIGFPGTAGVGSGRVAWWGVYVFCFLDDKPKRKYLGEVFDETEIRKLAPLRDLLGQGMLEVGLAPGK